MARYLKLHISAVGSMIKRFETSGAVMNLPVGGSECILSPNTMRRLVREARISLRIRGRDLQRNKSPVC